MLRRVALTLVLVGGLLFGCSQSTSFSYDERLRPSTAGTGRVVAKVLVFTGDVSVEAANGHRFAARPELPLLASDTVTVPPAGFAILQFANNHLTRLDADISLRLSDAAALSAPANPHSVQQQLTRLLTPAERTRPERIVGWHARMSAAEGVAVQSEAEQKGAAKGEEDLFEHKSMHAFGQQAQGPERERELDRDVRPPSPAPADTGAAPGPSGPPSKPQPVGDLAEKRAEPTHPVEAKAPTREPAPVPASKSPPLPSKSKRRRGGGAKRAAAEDALARIDDQAASRARVELVAWSHMGVSTGKREKKGPAPARLRWLIAQPAFVDCLMTAQPRPERGRTLRLMVSVMDGHLAAVMVPGRTDIFACMKAAFSGKPAGGELADGTYSLVVRLK